MQQGDRLGHVPLHGLLPAVPHRAGNLPEPMTPMVDSRGMVDRCVVALRATQLITLTGPGGVGKSRLAWEVTRPRGADVLWIPVGSRRAARLAGRDLASQIAHRLGHPEGGRLPPTALAERLDRLDREAGEPCLLVVDGVESAGPEEWETIRLLVRRAGRKLRLLLVGRAGTRWPEECRRSALLHLTNLHAESEEFFSRQALTGLSVPGPVEVRLREAAGGNPFALEEGLIHLATLRQLRRVYGSFFFGGDPAADYPPSPRWVAHLEAEAARLGEPMPLRLQALAAERLPADELAAAAGRFGVSVPNGWQTPFLATHWLRAGDGPWGEGVELPTGAVRAGFTATVAEAERAAARHRLGERLANLAGTADARWRAYRLLAGTAAAPRLLRAVATSPHAEVPRPELFEALRQERAVVAGRSGEDALELDLLWTLLPLARRLGRLQELEPELERALALAQSEGETDRLVALATLGTELLQNSGRFREAEALLRRALAASSGRDDRRKGLLIVELGRLLLRQARYVEARELLERALEVFDRGSRGGLAATCRFLLGNVAVHENRLAEAERLHREALEARRQGGVPNATAASLSALGALKLTLGDFPNALAAYREAEQLLAEHGKDGEEAFALIGLGRAYTRLGDHESAAAPLRRALALRSGRGDATGEAIARLAAAEHLLALERVELALAEARRAHFDLSLLPEGEARADAEHLVGRTLLSLRRFPEAERTLAEAERIHREAGKPAAAARDLARRLEVALAADDVEGISRFAGVLVGRLEALGENRPADEPFDFHLYRAADWLRRRGLATADDPLPHLRRAYDELMRQTAFLEPEHRSRFLFRIPHHRAILEAATQQLLALPDPAPRG